VGSHSGQAQEAGWSLGWVSAVDSQGRTVWIVDADRNNGKRFVIRSDEMLSAFAEKRQAIAYAETGACFRSGDIPILDSTGNLERTIAFDEADRKM